MFGTDLPSISAPRPYQDDDYTLVLETLAEEKAVNVAKTPLNFIGRKRLIRERWRLVLRCQRHAFAGPLCDG